MNKCITEMCSSSEVAHRLCVPLNSRRDSDKEEEGWRKAPPAMAVLFSPILAFLPGTTVKPGTTPKDGMGTRALIWFRAARGWAEKRTSSHGVDREEVEAFGVVLPTYLLILLSDCASHKMAPAPAPKMAQTPGLCMSHLSVVVGVAREAPRKWRQTRGREA